MCKYYLLVWCVIVIIPTAWPAKYVPKWKKQACEIPGSQSEYSHYKCDDDGELRCLPGWQGDLCDVPICRRGCDPLNGYCKRPGECRCKIGFYGERCSKCIPLPGCQQGYCNSSFECICQHGWDGIFCSEPVCRSDCHPTRGYCDSPGGCSCRLGWSGPTCRSCQPLPGCQRGYCDKPLECKCLPGFTGILCQTPICAKGCHSERGYCRRPGECRCRVGWTGERCDKCHPYPGCDAERGSCRRPWECNCEKGWGGMLCDEELNHCEKNNGTCQNGGKCTSLPSEDGSFRCECPTGFKGRQCELAPPPPSTTTTAAPEVTAAPVTLAGEASLNATSVEISSEEGSGQDEAVEQITTSVPSTEDSPAPEENVENETRK